MKMTPVTPFKRWFFSGLIISTLLLLAACGNNSTSAGSVAPASSPTAAATSNSSGDDNSGYGPGYGPGGSQKTPTPATSSNLIKTATVTISGKSVTILTNAQGLTLYYRTSDNPPNTVCSGGCATAWPPLLAPSSGTANSDTTLPGKLTVVATANGNQVEYNGHPLYTFSNDSAPGQTNGQGIANVWFVVTTDLK